MARKIAELCTENTKLTSSYKIYGDSVIGRKFADIVQFLRNSELEINASQIMRRILGITQTLIFLTVTFCKEHKSF